MSLIEKLLGTQTIQGPYLGETRALATPTPALTNGFQSLLAPQPAAPAPLQSLGMQLQLNVPLLQPAQPQLPPAGWIPQLPIAIRNQLSPATLLQIQQHPLESRFDIALQDWLLLDMLRRQGGRRRVPDQLQPSAFAQLSWVPLEKPFLKLAASRRKLRVHGIAFLHFRFAWEEDDGSRRQGRQQPPPAAPIEAEEQAEV